MKATAAKELEAVGTKVDRQRIVARIRALAEDPRGPGAEQLAGHEKSFRVRQGRYRIVYLIDDARREVTVYRIAHRRDVYR